MLKLRTILLYNYLYYLILLLVIIISIIRLSIPKQSNYSKDSTSTTGIVTSYRYSTNSLKLTLKNKENIIVYYYSKENLLKVKLGDILSIKGEFTKPEKNTTKYLFNYQKYLYNKNTHYIVTATNVEKINTSKNIYYKIKQFILEQTEKSSYLKAFILGDKSDISSEVTSSYQENGISHLFAISGMHITLLSSLILKLLKRLKVREEKRYLFTSIILIFYLSLIGLSPSALRGVLFFIFFSINKIYYFYIKPQNIFIVVLSLTLLINPFFIYDIGFQYSFIISITLILMSSTITGNYLLKLLKTSLLSFLISIPISLYNYFQINLLSIIYNLFYVPYVSFIIFPLSLITLILKPLLPIYNLLTNILEISSIYLNKITIGKIIFPRLNVFIYIVYIILIIIYFSFLKRKNHKPLIILILVMFLHYAYPTFIRTTYIKMIDVGQGDSILIHSNNETILVDTGGKLTFSEENNSSIVKNTTIPLLKSLGIRKIKTLILTHGDADHMQEAAYLIEHFKVENIIINDGSINYLEEELLTLTNNIQIGVEGTTLSCGDINLVQLNTNLIDENDSSQIYFAKYKNTTLLLTGDASIKSEEYILNNYELGSIDILKVGHHGSKTSTSSHLLQTINPKLALISCGKDNKFGHPHKTVLESLKKYNVNYLITAEEGTITIDLNTLKVT